MTTISNIIKLNVGGKQFQTTASTLRGSKFFNRMLNGTVPTTKDENGAYFIDRDPKYFKIILSYLRTFEWDIPATIKKDMVHAEAEFYMIDEMMPAKQPVKPKISPSDLPNPKSRFGLYSSLNGYDAFFIRDERAVFSSGDDQVLVVDLKSQNMFTYYGLLDEKSAGSGLFVNDGTNLILIVEEHYHLLELKSPKAPSKRFDIGADIPESEERIKIEGDAKEVQFKRGLEVIDRSDYSLNTSTGLISASIRGRPDLSVIVYCFDGFIVVDINDVMGIYRV